MIKKLISGGQTGADRAALDVAIKHNFPHGGWCPTGRLAEDGPLGDQYQLTETESRSYPVRTKRNVRDSFFARARGKDARRLSGLNDSRAARPLPAPAV
jgi:hypothetical protein